MSTYTTRARLQEFAQQRRIAAYADHNGDTAEDAGIITAAIRSACSDIDAELRKLYSVPFDTTSDVADEEYITTTANLLSLSYLLHSIDPERAASLKAEADARIAKIRADEVELDATRVAATTRYRVSYEAGERFVVGNEEDNYTTSGVGKLRGV